MKANELMIGDLIYVYGQNGNILLEPHWYVMKVTADWLVDMDIREANDKKLKEHGVVIPEQQSFIGDTKPIPLTGEILKANGWNIPRTELFNVYSSQYETHGGDTCITIDNIHHELNIRLDSINYSMPLPRYVHELQHALRLCGLNELANNFKNK